MKKLGIVMLAMCFAGSVSAECPVAADAELAKLITKNGGINDPKLSDICTLVDREGFEFMILGHHEVQSGRSFAFVNVLLADQELGIASSSHVATATEVSQVANAQESERLFLQAVSAAISGFMHEDAIAKLKESKSKVQAP